MVSSGVDAVAAVSPAVTSTTVVRTSALIISGFDDSLDSLLTNKLVVDDDVLSVVVDVANVAVVFVP